MPQMEQNQSQIYNTPFQETPTTGNLPKNVVGSLVQRLWGGKVNGQSICALHRTKRVGAKYIQPSENEIYLKIIFGRNRKEKKKNDKEFN
jgi:hypothetical protein